MCAFLRVSTFGAIQAHTGILTDRMARLDAAGLLRQQTAKGQRHGACRVTEKAVDLFPVLVCIEAWADAWQRDRYRSPTHLRHHPCGQPLLRGACNLHSG